MPATASATHKVFVCKYVGTPGVNERLKAGQNPISVDLHTIDGYRTFDGDIDSLVGGHFADAQGRSFVIAVDRGRPEPPVTVCPSPGCGRDADRHGFGERNAHRFGERNADGFGERDAHLFAERDADRFAERRTLWWHAADATPTPDPVTTPRRPHPAETCRSWPVTPQVTPPSTDTPSTIQADHGSNPAPVLLLLAALTCVFALATPHARGKARRSR